MSSIIWLLQVKLYIFMLDCILEQLCDAFFTLYLIDKCIPKENDHCYVYVYRNLENCLHYF